MKKYCIFIFIIFIFLLTVQHAARAQTMSDYCQLPAFVATPIEPNILMTMDVSGSMSWSAYNPNSSGTGWCSNTNGCGWTYTGSEEGYFDPDKTYKYNTSQGYWEEVSLTASSCPNVWWEVYNDTNSYAGSCLNFLLMARIDLVRWAMTGGTPASCTGSHRFNANYCDPELWNQSGNSGKVGSVCNDTIGGCILTSIYDDRVKVPWSRVYDGLAFQFKDLSLRPRIGAIFYSGTGIRSDKVYIGDFTAPNSTSDQFPYMNLITHINSTNPSGATPTGPALWDTLNYFAQRSAEYGGFTPQSGSGDHWRNPMYVCEQGGANCVYIPCAKNFVILLSDGQWNVGGDPTPGWTCSIDEGFENHSADPVVPAYQMHMGFTNEASGASTSVKAVYTIGLFLGGSGEQSLKNVAIYGSFDNASKTWPDSLTGYPQDTCYMDDCGNGKGSACTDLPPSSTDWDEDSDGIPDTFQNAQNATQIKDTIMNAVLDILKRASSGTAVSVLASGEGQGANLLQAVFYPKKTYGTDVQTELDWTGRLQNLWYYIDPYFNLSTIREDTITDSILNLKQDYITSIYFDSGAGKTRASLCEDSDGDGDCDNTKPTVDFEELSNLWEAGKQLFQKSHSNRTIYTNIDDDSTLDAFSLTNDTSLQSLLDASSKAEADIIIRYIRGEDLNVCSNDSTTVCTSDSDCSGGTCTSLRSRTATININGSDVTNTWKLGDVVNSTPRIQSWVPLNDYYERYDDYTYYRYVNDLQSNNTPKTTNIYTDRGMVYVGANDGMLHAFYLGKLEMLNDLDTPEEKAKITDPDTSDSIEPGDEVWSFIPKNALPYLKYLLDPDYCHLYYVDASPYIFDASIGTTGCSETNYWDCTKTTDTWRTILIGSMRLGGACRDVSSSCTDCVKTPISNVGYSSYFALDITDQNNPTLLWEFSSSDLGFSTAGPVIVKISPKTAGGTPDNTKNGRWFVVLASGPTGPIDTTTHEFKGKSDQNLKLFILDLKTGTLLRTIDTSIQNAFGGSQFNTTIDLDTDYQDDVVYLSYVKKVGSGSNASWTGGGIIRLATSGLNSKTSPSIDPNDWKWSKLIELDEGPVTSSVVYARDKKQHILWLFFGSGRYFYKTDDADGRRRLYGIKEPCYLSTTDNIDSTCTTTVSESDLTDATSTPPTITQANSASFKGWYVKLDCSATDTNGACVNNAPSGYSAERVITTPLASPTGVIFFTTFSPTSDLCGYGGNSYIWAVDYRTGGQAPGTALEGKALLQLSTGEIKEVNLKTAFSDRGGRRTASFSGVPPQGQGLSVMVPPDPIKKFIFMKEK